MILEFSDEERINKFTSRRSNDIYTLTNIFSDDMCNKLVEHVEENAKDRLELGPTQNVRCVSNVLTENDTFFKHVSTKLIDIYRFLNSKYLIHQRFGTDLSINDFEHICIRKIDGPTKLHQDGPHGINPGSMRILSIIIALNGDYDGGELVFPCQNFKTKLKQGEAIAFPPYWTHPHYTEELKNNTFRYTINTWLTL